jgi:hypothetical protein
LNIVERKGKKNRRKLCSDELHSLYSSPGIIRGIKSRGMRWLKLKMIYRGRYNSLSKAVTQINMELFIEKSKVVAFKGRNPEQFLKFAWTLCAVSQNEFSL